MTSKDFKKIARLLKTLYRELENRAIEEGIDITSDEYERMRDEVRDTLLTRMGYTIMEYSVAKNETVEQQKAQRQQERQELMETLEELRESIPTEEMIKELAKSVLPEPKIIEKTVNKIVKETTVEKPTIVQETKTIIEREEYDASPLLEKLEELKKKIEAIPEPTELNKEALMEEVRNVFGELFEHNIDVMNMPDFRKLAMGLQQQIEENKAAIAAIDVDEIEAWGQITGTLSDQTDLQTALDAKVDIAGDTMTGDLNMAADILPTTDNTRDLGSATNRFAEGRFNKVFAVSGPGTHTLTYAGALFGTTNNAQSFLLNQSRGSLVVGYPRSSGGQSTLRAQANVSYPVGAFVGGVPSTFNNYGYTTNVAEIGVSAAGYGGFAFGYAWAAAAGTIARITSSVGGAFAQGYVVASGTRTGQILGQSAGGFAQGRVNSSGTGTAASNIKSTGAGGFAQGAIQSGSATGENKIHAGAQGAFAQGYVQSTSNTTDITATGAGGFAQGFARGVGATSCYIRATGSGSFAHGFAGKPVVPLVGTKWGKILASGTGSFAAGYSLYAAITASNKGAFAFGYTTSSTAITASGINSFQFGPGTNATTASLQLGSTMMFDFGNTRAGIGQATPTAKLHFAAGSTAASSAPIKFTSGSLMTAPEVGALEFLTDKLYITITTGTAREEITLNDIALTSGRIPFATTNGRLTDSGSFLFATGTGLTLTDLNMVLGTTTGTKFGTATSQKLSFWNAAPIVQPTTGVAAATFVANTSGILDDSATFDGYTIGQIVKALRNIGLLA